MPRPPKSRRPGRSSTVTGQLRSIIKSRRLTAYAVATDAGLAPSVVSRFLTGERTLSGDSLDAVCSALGLELKETRRGRSAGVKSDDPDRTAG